MLACNRGAGTDDSATANVTIGELPVDGYDRYEIELKSSDPSFVFPVKSFRRGTNEIEVKVPPGTYEIRLDYYLKEVLVYGAGLCPEGARDTIQTFVSGPNTASIRVCSKTGGVAEGNTGKTFSIKSGQLVDKTGKAFVMRGINMPHPYFYDDSLKALPKARDFGFNAVRIVWCADTLLTYPERCNASHVRPPSDLEKIIQELRNLKMVGVLSLQNATGSTSQADLQALVNYLITPSVKDILIKNQDMLLINIANEWYGEWDKTRVYVDSYKKMIPQLRKAGLAHTLLIDAKGYGQDFSSVPEHGAELLAVDKNLLFSAHMYDVFGTNEKVKAAFATVRSQKLPFIVGEFACSHGNKGTVACDAIMNEAENADYKVGTIAWSYTGNNSDLSDLDLVNRSDWSTLTAFGRKIVDSPFGVKATSKQACLFSKQPCP